KASDNVDKKAWSSALGVGRTARAEANDSYTGNPTEIVENGIHSGFITLLDSEGIINAKLYLTDEVYFDKSTEFMLKFNGFQRKWEFETFDNLMKTITKKGTAYEKPKKDNKDNEENEKYDIGETFDDFILADKEGNAVNMHSIVQGNTATLVVFLRVNPEYDLNEGKESGKGKKGKSYMNDVAQTVAMEKQIEPLKNLEKGIFGKKQ
ncbi:MAG: hypothetical protein JW729_01755, partial [Bacteroidales bacterium]|nr:hypothetical protein [Bacteroidales bacterium]